MGDLGTAIVYRELQISKPDVMSRTCYCNLFYGFLGVVGASILVFRNNGNTVGLIRLGVDNAVAICSCCATPSSYQIHQVSLLHVLAHAVCRSDLRYGARNDLKPFYCNDFG